MGASKAQRAATAERRRAAIQLRMAGASWEMIKERCGYSDKGAACKDVSRALDQNVAGQRESAADLRAIELQRLDRLQLGLWGAATGGDHRAADTVLRLIDRRVRLLGLDTPPDEEQRIQQQEVDRLANHLFSIMGRVLDGLGLSEEQQGRVPSLVQEAVAALGVQPRREIEGEVAA